MGFKRFGIDFKCIFLYFFIGLITLTWFRIGHLIYFTDTAFPLNPLYDVKILLNSWSNLGFGQSTDTIVFFPYFITVYLLNLLLPLWLSQWITWYFIVVFSGIGFYFFIGYIFNGLRFVNFVSFLVGVTYMLSSYWIFSVLQDPVMAMIFYPIYPLIIYSFLRLLDEAGSRIFNKYILYIIILVFFLIPAIQTPYTFILLFTLVYISAIYFISHRSSWHSIRNQTVALATLATLLMGLFSPFLGSVYGYYISGYSAVTSYTAYIATLYGWLQGNSHGFFYSVLNTAYVIHGSQPPVFGWGWFPFYTSFPFFVLIYVGWPAISFLSLVFIKRIRSIKILYPYYIGLLILALICIFLQTGTADPTGILYTWLFYHFSPIRVFDTLNLWYSPILYLSYGVLTSFTLYGILTEGARYLRLGKKKFKQNKLTDYFKSTPPLGYELNTKSLETKFKNWIKGHGREIVVCLVIIWLLSPSYPLLNGMAVPDGFSSARVEFPSYELNTASYLNAQNGSFRVISFPVFTLLGEYNYSTGGFYGTPPLDWQLKPGISYIGTIYGLPRAEQSSIYALIQALYLMNVSEVSTMLNQLGLSYVVITGDYAPRITGIMQPFSTQRTMLILNNTPGVTRVARFGSYLIYHIEGVQLTEAVNGVSPPLNSSLYGRSYSLWPTLSGQDYMSNISYSSWGRNYSNAVLAPNGLNLYFNYSSGITNSTEIFTLIPNPEIYTNKFGYLMINITKFNGTNLNFQILNESDTPIGVRYNAIQNGLGSTYILNITDTAAAISGIEIIISLQSTVSGSKGEALLSSITPFYILNKYNWYSYQLNNISIKKNAAVIYDYTLSTALQEGTFNVTSTQYESPTLQQYKVSVYKNSTFVFVFRDEFSSGWILTIDGKVDKNHVLVNGFMNGWIITTAPGNYTFKLIYEPQKKFEELVTITFGTAIVYGAVLAYLRYGRKKKK